MSLLAMSLGLRFWPAKRVGQGEVGGFQPWTKVTWLLLGLAVESPLSALGGPLFSYCAQTGLENGLLAT